MIYRNTFCYFRNLIAEKNYTALYMLSKDEYQEALKLFIEDNVDFISKDPGRVFFRGRRLFIIKVVHDIFIDAILYSQSNPGKTN